MVNYDVALAPENQSKIDAAPSNSDIMHTHQSEQVSTQMSVSNGIGTETVSVNKHVQTPSVGPGLDTGLLKNGQTSYTFGMGSSSSRQNPGGNITIMSKDNTGSISRASIPVSRFVAPTSIRKVAVPKN